MHYLRENRKFNIKYIIGANDKIIASGNKRVAQSKQLCTIIKLKQYKLKGLSFKSN